MKKILSILLFTMLFTLTSKAQIVVTHFNASWNEPNKAKWVGELEECEITYVDITTSPKLQQRYKVVVVPTIIIFKDGYEVQRFQADLSFKMMFTKEEIQEAIDELIMSSF